MSTAVHKFNKSRWQSALCFLFAACGQEDAWPNSCRFCTAFQPCEDSIPPAFRLCLRYSPPPARTYKRNIAAKISHASQCLFCFLPDTFKRFPRLSFILLYHKGFPDFSQVFLSYPPASQLNNPAKISEALPFPGIPIKRL